jgi:CTP synthase
VEIMEIKNHPYYVATQFHPEYKSTVENPHPLFVAFVKAAKEAQEVKRAISPDLEIQKTL